MPDVREVYETITSQKPPAPGAFERQQKRQVRSARNKRIAAFAVAGVIALGAVALILDARTERHANRPVNEPSTPVRQPSPLLPASTHAFILDLDKGTMTQLPESLAGGYSYVPSPDGRKLAYSPSRGGGCSSGGVTIANIDGTGAQELALPKGFVACAPRWSSDGEKLVYQERRDTDDDVGNLFVYDLSSGTKSQVTHLDLKRAWWWFLAPRFGSLGGAEFSPELGADHVIFHLPRSGSNNTTWDVWSVPITGGQPTLVLRNATFPLLRSGGPEGLRIVFLLPEADNFEGQSLMTGRPIPGSDIPQTLKDANNSIWWPTISPDGSRVAFRDGRSIYVVDVMTKESSRVAYGNTAEWLDDHTLIVAP